MSFDTFLADPKGYLSTHETQVHSSADIDTALNVVATNAIINHFQERKYAMVGGQFLTMTPTRGVTQPKAGAFGNAARKMHIAPKIGRDFTVCASPADVGFRYLPDEVGYVTYMALDGAALLALTGPITGCTIAAGRDGAGTVWLFHAFRPDGTGKGLATIVQLLAIEHVAFTLLNIAKANMRYCRWGQEYNGMGFAFGRLRGNVWKFYAHATSVTPHRTTTNKWGEL
jgi:hypothetical protein